MRRFAPTRFLAAFLAAFLTISPVFAQEKAASPFTDEQKTAISNTIREYIMDNPQVLISSVDAYYNKQNENKKEQEGPIKQFPAGLLDSRNDPSSGPVDAKVTVVEFFDYACGYCKQVANDVDTLIDQDKKLRFIYKELPILSDTSELAARYALAANKQGKYRPYHVALLQHQGPINEAFLIETAKSVGIDTEKMKKDANTQEVRDVLAKNLELARELGVRGTPFFVIGREKVPGAIGLSRLKDMIAKERGEKAAPAAAVAPAAAPVAAPAAKTEETPAAEPKPAAAEAVAEEVNPENAGAQAEIDKAKAEARAMIDEIKAQATQMQKEALEAQKAAEKAAEKAAADAKKK